MESLSYRYVWLDFRSLCLRCWWASIKPTLLETLLSDNSKNPFQNFSINYWCVWSTASCTWEQCDLFQLVLRCKLERRNYKQKPLNFLLGIKPAYLKLYTIRHDIYLNWNPDPIKVLITNFAVLMKTYMNTVFIPIQY